MNDKYSDHELKQLEEEMRPVLLANLTKSPSHAETDELVASLQPELELLRPDLHR